MSILVTLKTEDCTRTEEVIALDGNDWEWGKYALTIYRGEKVIAAYDRYLIKSVEMSDAKADDEDPPVGDGSLQPGGSLVEGSIQPGAIWGRGNES